MAFLHSTLVFAQLATLPASGYPVRLATSARGPANEQPQADPPPPGIPSAPPASASAEPPAVPPSSAAAPAATVPTPAATPATPAPLPPVELPERNGRGLMIGAIATGALGWALSLATVGVIAQGCSFDDEDSDEDFEGLGECVLSGVSALWMTPFRWLANGAALGLAIPAGVAKGRYDATGAHLNNRPGRNSKAFVVGGALALGAGSITWLSMRIGYFAALSDCTSVNCTAGYFVGLQTGFAVASLGAGLLSYGVASKRRRERLSARPVARLVPHLGRHDAGLMLAGHF